MSESIVSVDEESLHLNIKELVKNTVRDVINQLLEEEADELVNAERYERAAEREAYRSSHYKRKLVTSAGEVELDVPKLRGATFQAAVIERCRRREAGEGEAIIEMYLAGVSTRRIEDVSQILWGAGVSAGTVSNLNDKAFTSVEEWRNRPLEGECPYVFADGAYLKRGRGGSCENASVMVAIGVNGEGDREVIGCAETLACTASPMGHWVRIRTNDAIERLNREIRRRTRAAGTFPDGKSAIMLVTARLKHVAESEWGSRRYLDVSMLKEVEA